MASAFVFRSKSREREVRIMPRMVVFRLFFLVAIIVSAALQVFASALVPAPLAQLFLSVLAGVVGLGIARLTHVI